MGSAFALGGSSFLYATINGLSLGVGGTVEGWVQVNTIPAMTADLFGFSASSLTLGDGAAAPPSLMNAGGLVASGVGAVWNPQFDFAGQSIGGSGSSYNAGQWVHVAVSWVPTPGDTGTSIDFTMYIDGTIYMTKTISTIDAGTPASFLIGGEGSGLDVTGLVDEVTGYGVSLPASDIASIHAAGTAGKCQCFTNASCPTTKPTCNGATHFCQ